MKRLDFAWLALFCLLLFGWAAVDGLSLSMHEARLPECSREMMRSGDWLVPRSGGRPWLERPPLPQWIEIGFNAIVGQRCDTIWAVRLPAAIMGITGVLATAWIASRWLGRWPGIGAGLVLATAFEFYKYSTLAEDDIFLAALVTAAMAFFVMTQSSPRPGRWPLLGLFVCAGLSNLCKGPLVGPMLIGATVGSYLLLQCVLEKSVRPLRPYLWLPGWLLAVAIGFWWVVVIWRHFPDFRQNLLFDYAQTDQYNQPFWYYLRELPGRFLPWTPVALLGLWIAWTRRRERVMQLLLCWSIFPILLLSIPNRKHHHYLVPCLAPWAILTAAALPAIAREMFDGPAWSRKPSFGLATFGLLGAAGIAAAFWFNRQKFQQPIAVTAGLILVWLACVYFFYFGLLRQNGRWVFGAVIAGLLVAYCWGQSYVPDENAADNVFLREANAAVPPDAPLYINAAQHSKRDGMTLDFFRVQFYSRPNARLLHNLTFLRDRTITAPVVYVITRLNDAPELETLGRATPVVESRHFRQQTDEGDRLALFRLEFRPDLQRYEAPREITTMQAMGRAPGPNCGPAASPQSSGR